MTIEFRCPDCQKLLRTADERIGQTAQCPACAAEIVVPDHSHADAEPGDFIPGEAAPSFDEPPGPPSRTDRNCPVCGHQLSVSEVQCPACGEQLDGSFVREIPADSSALVLSILSMIFGILSLASILTVFLCCLGPPLGILAVILGGVALQTSAAQTGQSKAMAIVGLICGSLSLLVFLLFLVFTVAI